MSAWLLLGLAGAKAQSLEALDRDQPIALVADRISFDNEAGTVTAEGNVEVYYGERTLTADRIVYSDATGRISAGGDIVLRDPSGTTVYADTADLDADLRDGLVLGAKSILGQNVRLAAIEGRRVDERYNTLSKVVYSPCEVCADNPTPLWRIRARRVIHDEEERIIHYENATFDVFGVPIAWLPYFRHPDPTVKRASGFLVPSYLSSSTFGQAIKVPYYFVIDDQSDATITPFFTTNDGLIVEAEYRRVFSSGELHFGGSIGRSDYDGDTSIRGHLDTEGLFDISSGFKWGWDAAFSSDDGYLRRFGFDQSDRLTSELFVRRYDTSGFIDVTGVYIQSLRDNEAAGSIPRGLPVIDTRHELPDLMLGGEVGLFASGHTLVRNNGRDVSRLTLGADWEREEVLPVGLSLTGFGEVRGDFFTAADDPVVDEAARLTGHAGIEARYPLVWASEGNATHIIEPVVQAIAAPYGGNGGNIPVEDSLVTEFDETNVIDRNHFSGLDNFEEGPRVNVSVRYQALLDNIDLDASIGRTFRLKAVPGFSQGSGLANSESDFVSFWQARYDPYVKVSHRMRFADDATLARNEFFGSVTIDPVEFGVTYAFFESDPLIGALADREEVNAETLLQLDRNWSVGAFLQRDLQVGEFVRVGGQVTFENECCGIDVFLRRRFTDSTDAPASTSVGVRVRLITLGTDDDR